MLYPERMRLQELADREAAGENVWTEQLLPPVRQKLWYAVEAAVDSRFSTEDIFQTIEKVVVRAIGLPYLMTDVGLSSQHVQQAIIHGETGLVLGVLEAIARVGRVQSISYRLKGEVFERGVNAVFLAHRCSYELVDVTIVPYDSQQLHSEVVAPTLRLLSGRQGWQAVEQAYQKALREIGDDPSDAITDAGTALQQALLLLGCEGNALGPLVKDAKRRGVLAPHDPTLADGVARIIDWVSADRSQRGDGHDSMTGASPEDAWLAVHVVGALILRLARGDRRGVVD